MSLDVMAELDRAGAVLLDRHFVYKSGAHGPGYINMDPIFPDAVLMRRLCYGLVEPFLGEADTLAAPAIGGVALVILGSSIAASQGWNISAVWADKEGKEFRFERAGFTRHLSGKRVLVLEDLLTTGGSALKVCQQVAAHGGNVIGVSAICNRGGVTTEDLGVPRLEALASVSFDAFPADACPLCLHGEPIVTDIGHGADYQQRNPDYHGGYSQTQV